MSAHTPGPWFAVFNGCFWDIVIGPGQYSPSVGTVHQNAVLGHETEEAEANARIMAAAPELLEALRSLAAVAEMTTFSDEYPAECEAARIAIANATGALS